jgi:hypothetical protein
MDSASSREARIVGTPKVVYSIRLANDRGSHLAVVFLRQIIWDVQHYIGDNASDGWESFRGNVFQGIVVECRVGFVTIPSVLKG